MDGDGLKEISEDARIEDRNRWAAFVWGYALAWLLVNDRIKLAAYRLFDRPGNGWLRGAAATRMQTVQP